MSEEAADADIWACPACTLHNPLTTRVCGVCGTGRPRQLRDEAPVAQPDGAGAPAANPNLWRCEACTFDNPNGVPVCGMCMTPRILPQGEADDRDELDTGSGSPQYGGADAMWTCSHCDTENSVQQVRCDACGSVMPPGDPHAAVGRRQHQVSQQFTVELLTQVVSEGDVQRLSEFTEAMALAAAQMGGVMASPFGFGGGGSFGRLLGAGGAGGLFNEELIAPLATILSSQLLHTELAVLACRSLYCFCQMGRTRAVASSGITPNLLATLSSSIADLELAEELIRLLNAISRCDVATVRNAGALSTILACLTSTSDATLQRMLMELIAVIVRQDEDPQASEVLSVVVPLLDSPSAISEAAIQVIQRLRCPQAVGDLVSLLGADDASDDVRMSIMTHLSEASKASELYATAVLQTPCADVLFRLCSLSESQRVIVNALQLLRVIQRWLFEGWSPSDQSNFTFDEDALRNRAVPELRVGMDVRVISVATLSHIPNREPGSQGFKVMTSGSFTAGDRVHATFRDGSVVYNGTVQSVNSSGTLSILYDDGDVSNVAPAQCCKFLAVNDRVSARWNGGPMAYEGVVTAVNDDGTFAILYDDGDREVSVTRSNIVSPALPGQSQSQRPWRQARSSNSRSELSFWTRLLTGAQITSLSDDSVTVQYTSRSNQGTEVVPNSHVTDTNRPPPIALTHILPSFVARDSARDVHTVLRDGADPNGPPNTQVPPLIAAASRGSRSAAAICRMLLVCGADVNVRANGRTALHVAAESGNELVVKHLLEFNADVACTDSHGRTPAEISCSAAICDIINSAGGPPSPPEEEDATIVASRHAFCENIVGLCGSHLNSFSSSQAVSSCVNLLRGTLDSEIAAGVLQSCSSAQANAVVRALDDVLHSQHDNHLLLIIAITLYKLVQQAATTFVPIARRWGVPATMQRFLSEHSVPEPTRAKLTTAVQSLERACDACAPSAFERTLDGIADRLHAGDRTAVPEFLTLLCTGDGVTAHEFNTRRIGDALLQVPMDALDVQPEALERLLALVETTVASKKDAVEVFSHGSGDAMSALQPSIKLEIRRAAGSSGCALNGSKCIRACPAAEMWQLERQALGLLKVCHPSAVCFFNTLAGAWVRHKATTMRILGYDEMEHVCAVDVGEGRICERDLPVSSELEILDAFAPPCSWKELRPVSKVVKPNTRVWVRRPDHTVTKATVTRAAPRMVEVCFPNRTISAVEARNIFLASSGEHRLSYQQDKRPRPDDQHACPLCSAGTFDVQQLGAHVSSVHAGPGQPAMCPVCVAGPRRGGDRIYPNFQSHFQSQHMSPQHLGGRLARHLSRRFHGSSGGRGGHGNAPEHAEAPTLRRSISGMRENASTEHFGARDLEEEPLSPTVHVPSANLCTLGAPRFRVLFSMIDEEAKMDEHILSRDATDILFRVFGACCDVAGDDASGCLSAQGFRNMLDAHGCVEQAHLHEQFDRVSLNGNPIRFTDFRRLVDSMKDAEHFVRMLQPDFDGPVLNTTTQHQVPRHHTVLRALQDLSPGNRPLDLSQTIKLRCEVILECELNGKNDRRPYPRQVEDSSVTLLAKLVPHVSRRWISNALTGRLQQQLLQTVTITCGALPMWCSHPEVLRRTRALFDRDVRIQMFRATAFGLSRAVLAMQQRSAQSGPRGRRMSLDRHRATVDRENLLADAMDLMQTHAHRSSQLEVVFRDERGYGAGVTASFFTAVAMELEALPVWAAAGPAGLFPRPGATDALHWFELMGKLAGKAMQDQWVFPLPLSVEFLELVKGERELQLSDAANLFEHTGEHIYQLAAGEKTGFVEGIEVQTWLERADLWFSDPLTGQELRSEPVTTSNLTDFICALEKRWLQDGVAAQVDAFRRGLETVVDMDRTQILSARELRDVLCGSGTAFTMDELQSNVVAGAGYTENSTPYQLLLRTLERMTQSERSAVLAFVTGCPRLPAGGLSGLNPKLEVVRRSHDRLPFARTCQNSLHLPPYESEDELRDMLMFAVRNAGLVVDRD